MVKNKFLREFDEFFNDNKEKLNETLILKFIEVNLKNRKLSESSKNVYLSKLFTHLRTEYDLKLKFDFIKVELKKQ